MQSLSYPTVSSNKITRNRIVQPFKDSPRKPFRTATFNLFLPIKSGRSKDTATTAADSALLPDEELAEVRVGVGGDEEEEEEEEEEEGAIRAVKNEREKGDSEEGHRGGSQSGYKNAGCAHDCVLIDLLCVVKCRGDLICTGFG